MDKLIDAITGFLTDIKKLPFILAILGALLTWIYNSVSSAIEAYADQKVATATAELRQQLTEKNSEELNRLRTINEKLLLENTQKQTRIKELLLLQGVAISTQINDIIEDGLEQGKDETLIADDVANRAIDGMWELYETARNSNGN